MANCCNMHTVDFFNKPTKNIGKILDNTPRNEELLYENALINNRRRYSAIEATTRLPSKPTIKKPTPSKNKPISPQKSAALAYRSRR